MKRHGWVAIAIVIAWAQVAGATPSDVELASIQIPPSDPAQTDLAKRLSNSCKILTARSGAIAKSAEKVKLTAVNDACQAIRGEIPFDDASLASLREYRDKPELAALVDALEKGGGEKQFGEGLTSILSTGSLYGYVIEGFAKFIYDRAKAEAIKYLTDKLKGVLCEASRKPFFRNVCVVFEEMDSTIKLQAIGSALAAAARRDVEKLPDVMLAYGLESVTAASTCKADQKVTCEALVAGRVALAFYEELRRGRAALDTVRSLHAVSLTDLQKAAAPNTAKAMRWGSATIDAILKQDGWDRVKPLVDPAKSELPFYAIATALTVETLLAEKIGVDVYNGSQLLPRLGQLFARVKEVLERIEKVRKSLEGVREKVEGGSDMFDDQAAETTARTAVALTTRDYLAASTGALTLSIDVTAQLQEVLKLSPAGFAKLQKIIRLGELLASGAGLQEIGVEINELFVLLVGQRDLGGVAALVNKVLPLITQLATAKSADEVAKVLEAAAAPVGTYKRKADERMTTINAFVGVAGGPEYIPDAPLASQIGVFSPVGLHVSWPSWCGNWGVMFSVINLGSLVSQRFNEEDDTEMLDVDPEQSDSFVKLFSPGVFFTKSIAGPFTIGAGVQFVPAARDATEMTPTGPKETTRSAVQPMLFIGIDVSIFPL